MTIEEAIKEIKDASDSEVRFGDTEYHYNEVMKRVEAFSMAIKALKQESVLDKIRAEIMDFEEELFHRPNTDYTDYAAVRHCVEIIDKYKTERSGEE